MLFICITHTSVLLFFIYVYLPYTHTPHLPTHTGDEMNLSLHVSARALRGWALWGPNPNPYPNLWPWPVQT